jgi:hypothetical protein
VPPLVPRTREERRRWREAQTRREKRLHHRAVWSSALAFDSLLEQQQQQPQQAQAQTTVGLQVEQAGGKADRAFPEPQLVLSFSRSASPAPSKTSSISSSSSSVPLTDSMARSAAAPSSEAPTRPSAASPVGF